MLKQKLALTLEQFYNSKLFNTKKSSSFDEDFFYALNICV
jgi:hypothetical protein